MLIEAHDLSFVRDIIRGGEKDIEKRVCFECAINYDQNSRPYSEGMCFF